jgi:hypothetical protein
MYSAPTKDDACRASSSNRSDDGIVCNQHDHMGHYMLCAYDDHIKK